MGNFSTAQRAGAAALLALVVACGSSDDNAAPATNDGGSTTHPGDGSAPPDSGTNTGRDATTTTPDGNTGNPDSGGACGDAGSGIFSAPNAWMRDVSCDLVAPESQTITDALVAAGGWGTGATSFQIDFSLVVLHADATTPMVPFVQAPSYPTPDCDTPTTIPLVPSGAIEGQTNYTCDVANNDCHLLVDYPPTHTLYEIYQATSQGAGIVGGCAVLWDVTKTYPDNLRGDQCTSADAAGFPMSAMLPDADEVASGSVNHAIRFALPNPSIRSSVYVHPASHAGGPSGGANLPPYGVRMRLKSSFDLTK